MAHLVVDSISKRFGSASLFENLDLAVEEGEFLVLVGPSGCGKSTLLRLISGLDAIDGGAIHLDGRRIDPLAPGDRGIAMVFQSYALYPQMTVRENLAFPLRMAKVARAERAERVAGVSAMLGLDDLLERRPAELSGGQRQRVAIGRAIVRSPSLFLFDEPLSNLDAGLRTRVRREFSALHRRLRTTTIYVTHDQAEAMTLADRIVLLRDGRIEQVGTPEAIYNAPANTFVAGFFGAPQINLLAATATGRDGDGTVLTLAGDAAVRAGPRRGELAPGLPVTIGIRPEGLIPSDAPGALRCTVRATEWFGGEQHVFLDSACGEVVWRTASAQRIGIGERLGLTARDGAVHLFGGDGQAIA